LRRASVALLAAALLGAAGASTAAAPHAKVRVWKVDYRAHNGARRSAYVVLPSWYGPRFHPAIPLVISPHGRGLDGHANARIWGNLPAIGGFAVINPDGQGRRLPQYSWGSSGQVADLARMPTIAERTLPWLHIDRTRVYAFGGSMGGQEALLLLARHPRLLAGAAVFDAVVDFARQYREFPRLRCEGACRRAWREPYGRGLQALARREIGGPPHKLPLSYRLRSPVTYVRAIAASCVPLQIWWSDADRIVIDQQHGQSGPFFWKLRELNPRAPVSAFVGFWIHSAEMKSKGLLPLALARFDLLPPEYDRLTHGLHVIPPPDSWPECGLSR
jgi:poly(3-hydroxybutyrate) depolymerase